MRWFAVDMLIGHAGGDVEMTVDVKAENPAEAIGQAVDIACKREHVQRHWVCVQRCTYNDIRPLIRPA